MFLQVVILLASLAVVLATPIVRIVNGTDAKEGEIPYIVSLRAYGSHNCGGSILNERFILTAAHCVKSWQPYYLTIQYGVTTISSGADAVNVIQVSKVIYNQKYTPGHGYINDVAVLKLAEPIVFGPNAQPIKLPRAFNATPENAQALLAGWGLSHSGGAIMKHLQKVTIQVYTDAECEKRHAHTGPTNRNYHVCAGVPEGGKGQCNVINREKGDSGGPLVVDGIVVGIVSWSVKPCTIAGYPGVFTKVSSQRDWIDEQIANNQD